MADDGLLVCFFFNYWGRNVVKLCIFGKMVFFPMSFEGEIPRSNMRRLGHSFWSFETSHNTYCCQMLTFPQHQLSRVNLPLPCFAAIHQKTGTVYTVFNYFAYAWLVVTYALTTPSSVQSSYLVGGVLSFALRWLALSVHTLTWTNWHYLSHQGSDENKKHGELGGGFKYF